LRPAAPLPATSDERQATGRERHDQKITVYLSAGELLELEHARLRLRRFGFVLDRGRLVREAIAILLADLDARGKDSLVARRVRSAQEAGTDQDGGEKASRDTDEDKGFPESTGFPETTGFPESTGFSESTVPSLTWAQPLAER